MGERDEFGFCPKCGAVMYNGVCQSCGYTKRGMFRRPDSQEAGQDGTDRRQTGSDRTEAKQRRRNGGTAGRVLAVVGIIAGILLLVLVLITVGVLVFKNFAFNHLTADRSDGFDRYYDYYDGSGDLYDDYDVYDGYEPYVPDENDEYYQEITDATSLDCSYHVVWQAESLYPDDPENLCTYDCVYPVVSGEGAADYGAVNDRIRSLVCRYRDFYGDYEGVTSYGYVTYMDEDTLSVVVQHQLDEGDHVIPELDAVSFYMDTGEVIPEDHMAEADEELVRQFRARDAAQNGGAEFVEDASDEELLRLLGDEEANVMFYTPVGLEIGFNYDGGWVTVTLKDHLL